MKGQQIVNGKHVNVLLESASLHLTSSLEIDEDTGAHYVRLNAFLLNDTNNTILHTLPEQLLFPQEPGTLEIKEGNGSLHVLNTTTAVILKGFVCATALQEKNPRSYNEMPI